MIHCTTEDLLALKAGEGSSWARRHHGECTECQKELDVLHQRVARLKALPTLNPPRDRWPVIRDRVVAERRQQRTTHVRWAAVAIAASLGGIIGTRVYDHRKMEATRAVEVAALISHSQELEAKLRAIDPESRVLTGATAGAVSELEDRIASIDAQLGQPVLTSGSPTREQDLWRNRVELMQGLVNVHVTRAAYLGM
ncbi:MAG: hypothetical protein EXR93_09075 [Gemmatimonadetes bacterium]|nr:hypothetical protein [Gemmatimonadota bacterium]